PGGSAQRPPSGGSRPRLARKTRQLLARRIIGRVQEGGLHAILHGQGTARLLLGSLARGDPVWVLAKGVERRLGRVHTSVRQQVDERVVSSLLILQRHPVAHVGHAVLLEQLARVLAKTRI